MEVEVLAQAPFWHRYSALRTNPLRFESAPRACVRVFFPRASSSITTVETLLPAFGLYAASRLNTTFYRLVLECADSICSWATTSRLMRRIEGSG